MDGRRHPARSLPQPRGARAIWVCPVHLAVPTDMVSHGESLRFRGHPELSLVDMGIPRADHLRGAPELLRGDYRVFRIMPRTLPVPIDEGEAGAPLDRSAVDLREVVRELLRHAPVLEACRAGISVAATRTQIPHAVDELHQGAASAPLGIHWSGGVPSLHLWAPTALDVSLLLWPLDDPAHSGVPAGQPPVRILHPNRDPGTGIWSITGETEWVGGQYLWRIRLALPEDAPGLVNDAGDLATIRGGRTRVLGPIEGDPHTVEVENFVTDPYAIALTVDSARVVLVDPNDEAAMPRGWQTSTGPRLRNRASETIWELHVRDFSARDYSVPAGHRGTYLAFTHPASDGMTHLVRLAEAGITSVHLQPTYDFATVPEDRVTQTCPELPGVIDPAGAVTQAAIAAQAATDAYDWGYEPFHWMAPEGSYATEGHQDGAARLFQHRQMVAALHAAGLRVIVDVVHNHTAASGQWPQSVLDRIVPGYHHRLDEDGAVHNSTCNDDTASEHLMAGRLVHDSIVHWARHHRVDGFRVDLMGHHPVSLMKRIRASLDSLSVERDGVDGRAISLYGEAWEFGPVAGDVLFEQATLRHIGGSGIGAFNDRLRDAVRGGGPFDVDHRSLQGWATGLHSAPNGVQPRGLPRGRLASALELELLADVLRLALVGNLAGYPLPRPGGGRVRGEQYHWRGSPVAWAYEPHECVNYVDAHDNETLYDECVWKLPVDTPMSERIRVNTLALAAVTLGQGVSFWHAGTEILRSKSLDRDSVASGDHVNALDWTLATSGFGTGLPVESKNGQAWAAMVPLLSDPALRPGPADMAHARDCALDLLRIRRDTPLLTLGTAERIRQKVHFPALSRGQGEVAAPGLVVMIVEDGAHAPAGHVGPWQDLDPAWDAVMVVFNPAPWPVSARVEGQEGRRYVLHPVQADGADPVLRQSTWDPVLARVGVPGRSAVVFLAPATVV